MTTGRIAEDDPLDRNQTDWITVGTFPSGMDLALIEARLMDAGIPYQLRDALTIQIAPHLSNALGGVRLQVEEMHRGTTLTILQEAGVPITDEPVGSPMLEWFEARTSQVPLIGQVSIGWRLIIIGSIVSLLLALVVVVWFRSQMPTNETLFSKHNWCIGDMELDGHSVGPRTLYDGVRIVLSGCEEQIKFAKDGTVIFPGLNSHEVTGAWTITSDSIRIYDLDTLKEIYEGQYAFRISEDHLVMRSDRLYLRASDLLGVGSSGFRPPF